MTWTLFALSLAARAQDDAPSPDVPGGAEPPPEAADAADPPPEAADAADPPPEAADPPPEPPDSTDRDAILDDIDAFLGDADPAPPPPPRARTANALNPSITAFGDVLTTLGWDGGGVDPRSGPWVRSFELDVRSDVDPYAKAVAVFAVEQENALMEGEGGPGPTSEFGAAPEELYIDLVSLPAGFSARVGQFRLPFGLTNRMHPHDWPWPGAPLPFQETLGAEGLSDTGASGSWRGSLPGGVALSVDGGASSGGAFDPEGQVASPAWMGRVELFADAGDTQVGIGASGHGRGEHRVEGADLMLRWRESSWRSVTLIGELFASRFADDPDAGIDASSATGWTATLQVQPTRPLYIGLRADQVLPGDTDGGDVVSQSRDSGAWRFAGYTSYYTSEFLRLRAGAEYTTVPCSWLANAQVTFVWGSHPVEPYWVNR